MGTVVTVQALRSGPDASSSMNRAFGWFHEIESRCTRFDPSSELRQLTAQVGVAVPAGAILFEAVRFALLAAEASGGAFDPTIGRRMEARGFNRDYRSGERSQATCKVEDGVSFRDVRLDEERRTIALLRPLTLDLGAVAKGLAVDLAARELAPLRDFAIDAGGDLYLGGRNEHGEPWRVGVRHPRNQRELIASLRVSDRAVCTSGDYERRVEEGGEHHILDPRTGGSPRATASATVVAAGAMLADALATAAFVLGPEEGVALLERMGVDGLIVAPDLARFATRGLHHVA